MTTVIHHTTVVTGDRDPSIHFNAAIAIENDLIAAIGPSDEVMARFPNAEGVDGRGKLVMPGFANCHTHFVRILARGIFEDQNAPNRPPFTRKGRIPFPTLNPEQRAAMARLGVLEALRSGTTAAMDITNNIEDYAEAIVATGLRLVLAEQVADRAKGVRVGEPGVFEADPELADKGLQRIADLHAKWHGAENGRVTVAVAAYAPDMVSPALLQALRELREKLDTIATIHLNQYWGEVEVIKNSYGMLPTEYLARHGFLHERLVAAHCRCMTPEEEKILGASGASVSFNPVVAARSGNSPHVTDLETSGCRIALGTDEFTEDMVQVLRSAVLIERLRLKESERPTTRGSNTLGDGQRLPCLELERLRILAGREQGGLDRRKYSTRSSGPGVTARRRFRLPRAAPRRGIRHSRRTLAHAEWQSARDGRGRGPS